MQQNYQPELKVNTSDSTPISQLYPGMNNYQLRVRVTKKNQLRKIQRQDGKEFSVFSVDLIDSEGAEITCHFYEQVAEKYFDQIEQDKVYEIKDAVVKLLNNKIYNKGEDYLLNFDRGASIKVLEDDNKIQRQKFEFKPIQQLQNLQAQAELDICGVVHSKEIKNQKLKDGKEVEILNLEVYDQDQKIIKLNLWDKKFTEINVECGDFVALKQLKVLEFQTRKELSSQFQTLLFVNQFDIPELSELKTWQQQNQEQLDLQYLYEIPTFQNANKNSHLNQSNLNQTNIQTFQLYSVSSINKIILDAQNTQDKNKKIYNNVRIHIDFIKPDGQIFYLSCSQDDCQKKVTKQDENSPYYCPKHNECLNPIPKFMTSVKVLDATGSIHAQLFGNIGQEIFQITEQEVQNWVQNDDLAAYREYMSRIQFQEYLVTIMSKFDLYQEQYKVRHQIIKVFPFSPSVEGKFLVQQILQYQEPQQFQNYN
ncbi:Nucleic acid-binding, OB-fold [Pseudocohnilembus persalinus]|uniref:Nucleic acid-binding, OB-fold n=1 Tax=Pseudocohnilembus persalinus TaxID=266149 RepID=A0A0V0QXH2_PSEPJ|nr:Nucleic acid-binding, OB-fold [Pseudocohnilembus persalinus]|eukprot:KRX06581.1 Nucleic acid-binding, OB-fold [Pseudocohnilembus persalinus]